MAWKTAAPGAIGSGHQERLEMLGQGPVELEKKTRAGRYERCLLR